MKHIILFLSAVWFPLFSIHAAEKDYQPIDPADPVQFDGTSFLYQGKEIIPDEKNFFVDGSLPDEVADRYPYVFNSVNAALSQVTDGTADSPMTLYIAPYVYWIDDPDDPAIRTSAPGTLPFGMIVECNGLRLYGLNNNPENIVLACNRGQTHGAIGNFTMFHFIGNDLRVENLTMGNYCNVDLEYPLLTLLNRPKRASAIVQGQLAICKGDRISAWNCRFISRLNTCPMVGGKRTYFKDCHFECTDDALCATGVHEDCTFTFFSSKPFYTTQPTGAVFLNCDIEVLTLKEQFMTKAPNPVTLIDCRFTHVSDSILLGWDKNPPATLRCYQYNVTLNGKPYLMQPDRPEVTVNLNGKQLLNAYRIQYRDKVIYNTYNLLCGDDGWDPAGIKEALTAIGKERGTDYTSFPVFLGISPQQLELSEGGKAMELATIQQRFGGYSLSGSPVNWQIKGEHPQILSLSGSTSGTSSIKPQSPGEFPEKVTVNVSSTDGLEAACPVTVYPERLPAPMLTSFPVLQEDNGIVTLIYQLELNGRPDESLIDWYRCNAETFVKKKVAVSRLNTPLNQYTLTEGDEGCYIMASISPKHRRSDAGSPVTNFTTAPVKKEEIKSKNIHTDFVNFPTDYQPDILPGHWTVDCYKPLDTYGFEWDPVADTDTWYYGTGIDGTQGTGLVQSVKGARLLYTPMEDLGREMSITLNVDPAKTAGQGFGSATGQYMDIYINFDTRTLSGYGLRIVRTPKHDRAVDFVLMKYENGESTEITEPVSSNCYYANCTITLKNEGNRLFATASSPTDRPAPRSTEVVTEVFLSAEIVPTGFDGMGIQHTGSVGASATMLHELKVEWNK